MSIDFSTDEGKALRASLPMLKGKRVIGKGMFAMVFGNGDTVYKLTMDRTTHALHTHSERPTSKHFPKVIADFGEVGVYRDIPVFLLELERLRRINSESIQANYIEPIYNHYWRYYNGEDVRAALIKTGDKLLDNPLREGVYELADFIPHYEEAIGADIHTENVMIRPSTGELVLSDPVYDCELADSAPEWFNA